MKRIMSRHAYGPGPRESCWWDETVAAPDWPSLNDKVSVDVGIVGGGFTGISAALHLAEAGLSVAVAEAETPGWGASGRNGGFCCLGGAKASRESLVKRHGEAAANEYFEAERNAVALVAQLLKRFEIQADTHSNGETQLAHRPKDFETLKREADIWVNRTGTEPQLIAEKDLPAHGMIGPFFGALTLPDGFGINPRKYLFGIADAAQRAGAHFFQNSPVTGIEPDNGGYTLRTAAGTITCQQVIVATNGYSSENIPDWLANRYMPAQSNVLVTRPLTNEELSAQGWTSQQMAYDTRDLLHYFRLMPDNRFLFGMRGSLMSSSGSEKRARKRTRSHFERMFPAWAKVESNHTWSGMVCLSRNLTPFAGPVPGQPGVYAGLAYHGNGVAMGSYTGMLLAGLISGGGTVPQVMQQPMARFPAGRWRRALLPPAYLLRFLSDL